MTIVKNPNTGRYEGDFRARSIGRLHLSLRTKKIGEARTRHSAVAALIAQGYGDLVDRLRRGTLTVQAVERVHQAGGSFAELREQRSAWPTLQEATDDYLAAIAAHPERSARTHQYAEQMLRVALDYFGAGRRIETVTAEEVAAYQTMLREERKLHANSVGNYLVRLGALFRWVQQRETRRARQEERAARTLYSPVDRETVPKYRGRRVRFLAEDEAARLYVAAPPQYRFAVALGLYAGLRLMEALMLRPMDMDLDLELVHVQARELPDPWAPKRRKNRDVPMSAALRTIYERHLAAGYAGTDYLTPAPPSLHHHASPRTRAGGGPFSATRWRDEFTPVVERAGLVTTPRHPLSVTPHTLRHTFASWLVMEGTDLLTVARLMGHATITEVQDTYGHLAPEHKRRAVEKLAGRLALPLDPEESA